MSLSKLIVVLLILISITIWGIVVMYPDDNLHIITCDVGQGDAILVTYGTVQIIVDGGPDNSVVSCLSKHIPFWDREIEFVILTHPQADHFTGFIEVVRRYKIDHFLKSNAMSDSESYQLLLDMIDKQDVQVIHPDEDTLITIGTMYLDVIYPSEQMDAAVENQDLNDYSVIFKLSLDEFDALFTGDIGSDILEEIIEKEHIGKIELIKIPHHGSKYGLSMENIQKLDPDVSVISAGKNQWGHPNQEVLDILKENEVSVLRTDEYGDIEIVSDGRVWWVE